MELSISDVNVILLAVEKYGIRNLILDLDGVVLCHRLPWREKIFFGLSALWNRGSVRDIDKKWLFDKLHAIERNVEVPPELVVYNEGLKLPPIMCLWQAGVLSSNEAQQKTLEKIDAALSDGSLSAGDAHVLRHIAGLTFDVPRFTEARALTPAGTLLLRLAVERKMGIAFITNYALDQFEASKAKFSKSVFDLVPQANIIVSAAEKMVKPALPIFKLCLDRCGFDANVTLFVDDEEHNVLGGMHAGIRYGYVTGAPQVLIKEDAPPGGETAAKKEKIASELEGVNASDVMLVKKEIVADEHELHEGEKKLQDVMQTSLGASPISSEEPNVNINSNNNNNSNAIDHIMLSAHQAATAIGGNNAPVMLKVTSEGGGPISPTAVVPQLNQQQQQQQQHGH